MGNGSFFNQIPSEFFRNCPDCGKKIFYKSQLAKTNADKKNPRCFDCWKINLSLLMLNNNNAKGAKYSHRQIYTGFKQIKTKLAAVKELPYTVRG
jgi:predicted  nucleic acid-binding Zn-ribbon protein